MLSTVKSRNGEQIQTRKVYYKDNRSRNGEMEKYSKQFTATALFFNSEKKKTFPLNEKKIYAVYQ